MKTPVITPGVSVAVMCYNEAASLEAVVLEIAGVLAGMGCGYEIVIIDDGSSDGSGEVADRLAGQWPAIRVVHHPANLGLGAVYREAFTCGRHEWVTIFPADGQFEAAIIPQFARRMADGADLVLGYVPGLEKTRSALGWFFSLSERLLLKILFGGFPEFQGIMMFRRRLIDTIPLTLRGRGWMIQMELILRLRNQGCRLESEPTGLRSRMSGASKAMTVSAVFSNLRQVFVLRWRLWRG